MEVGIAFASRTSGLVPLSIDLSEYGMPHEKKFRVQFECIIYQNVTCQPMFVIQTVLVYVKAFCQHADRMEVRRCSEQLQLGSHL